MKACIATGLALAILAGPAYAQNNKGPAPDDGRAKKAMQAEKERGAVEKEYNDTMKRLRREPAAKSDPWGKVRPSTETTR